MDDRSDIPRRLEANDETVEYLLSLNKQLSENGIDESDGDAVETLLNNVLSEIKSRSASLASDRRTSLIIEKIVLLANITHLMDLCRKLTPYIGFLARNRYSSHVLQSLLSRVCYLMKTTDTSEDIDDIESTMTALIEPIIEDIFELSKDISASHVLRSAICLLAGIFVITERKGKQSKHQHSVSHSITLDSLISARKLCVDPDHFTPMPTKFGGLLETAGNSLQALEPSVLHELLADHSSCAVIGLVIRLLSASPALTNGSNLAEAIFRKAIEWADHVSSTDFDTKLFYAMAGDKSGSHFLEACLENISLPTIVPLLRIALVGKLHEYVTDNVANFVVQSGMKRLGIELELEAEFLSTKVKNPKISTIPASKKSNRKKEDDIVALNPIYGEALTLAIEFVEESLSVLLFNEIVTYKGGVLLWLLVLARQACEYSEIASSIISVGTQEKVEDLCVRLAGAVVTYWTGIPGGTASGSQISTSISTRLMSSSTSTNDNAAGVDNSIEANSSAGKTAESKDTGRAEPAKVVLAKQIGALLRMKSLAKRSNELNSTSLVLDQIASGVAGLQLETLKMVSTSGQLSRAMLDPLIDRHSQSSYFGKFIKSMIALSPILAGHYVGQHIFRKVYECSSVKDKERFVQALVAEYESLSRFKEGKNSLRLVNADEFKFNSEEWVRAVKRQQRAMDMLKELEGASSLTEATAATNRRTASIKRVGLSSLDTAKSSNSRSANADQGTASYRTAKSISTVPRRADMIQDSEKEIEDKLDDKVNDDRDGEDGDALSAVGGGRKRKRKRSHKNASAAASVDFVIDPKPKTLNFSVTTNAIVIATPTENQKEYKSSGLSIKTAITNPTHKGNPKSMATANARSDFTSTTRVYENSTHNNHKNTHNRSQLNGARVDMGKIRDLKGANLLTGAQLREEAERLLVEKKRLKV